MKYLCEEYKDTARAVDAVNIYMEQDKIKEECSKLEKEYPQNSSTVIDTVGLYKLYFKSPDGKGHLWKIVLEIPNLPVKKDAIYVRVWFPTSNVIVKADIMKFDAFADDFEMVALLAFVQRNIGQIAYFDQDKFPSLDKFA